MQVTLQKIDRRSKPIKKHSKLTEECLFKKGIFLEDEDFDILGLLRRNSAVEFRKKQEARKAVIAEVEN